MEFFHEVKPQPGELSVEVISHSVLKNAHLSCARSNNEHGINWNWRSGGSAELLFRDMRNLARKKKIENNRCCFVMAIFQNSVARGLTLEGVKSIVERSEQFINDEMSNFHMIVWVSKFF